MLKNSKSKVTNNGNNFNNNYRQWKTGSSKVIKPSGFESGSKVYKSLELNQDSSSDCFTMNYQQIVNF